MHPVGGQSTSTTRRAGRQAGRQAVVKKQALSFRLFVSPSSKLKGDDGWDVFVSVVGTNWVEESVGWNGAVDERIDRSIKADSVPPHQSRID